MNAIPFDTLKMARKMEAAGFSGRVWTDVEILRRDMTIRLGAMEIASTGVMIAAMRFMLTHS
jgi:hypothetical protein